MDEVLGNVSYESEPSPYLGAVPGVAERGPRYSEDTTQKIDEAVRGIIQKALGRASAILKARRGILEEAAKELLEHETLDAGALAPFARSMGEACELQGEVAAA